MLTAAPLPVLLKAPLTYLSKLCPWIPTRIISNFYKLVHDESPFYEQPSKAPMLQRRDESRDGQTEPILQDRTIVNQGSRKVIEDATRNQEDMRHSDLLHQEHGGSKGWSMLQNGRKTQGRDDLRQSHQDVPVKIKSEPVDSPVYDLDGQAMYPVDHFIPDDLKTPLELLASSDTIGKDQLSSSRHYSEAFDPEHGMDTGANPHSSRDRLGHLSKDRSGQRELLDLQPYASTSKIDYETGPSSREWIMEEKVHQGLHSNTMARARKTYSGLDDILPRQHKDNWGNRGLYDMDPFPTRGTQKQAPMKYIGIAQPCPRPAGKDCSTKKTNPSNYMTTSRSGEFGTLATAGLPARRGSASMESLNQSQGNPSMQRHPLEYHSQYFQRPDDHQYSERQQTAHSRNDYRGMDMAMLQGKGLLQGQQASSYQYQTGNAFPDAIGQLSSDDMYTDGTTKKRRLTYERVPGSKGGQTRLAFR
ncbi:uncharacterized protein LOC121424116 [Lytechinus variegatus]|uniref:uncharacterized protein LOC121424116 n=1 Tax=Lytechinus variegatus TaxID=7654 RepID=UPI001BB13C55|nr:uncharacterized protein LOC121424116 [Lytechinus variegatus]